MLLSLWSIGGGGARLLTRCRVVVCDHVVQAVFHFGENLWRKMLTSVWFNTNMVQTHRWILGEVKWGGAGLRGIVSEPQGNAVEERQEYGLGGDGRLGTEDTLVLYTDLQFLIDAMVEAVVLVVIFAFVQRIVFHVLGKGSLHLVYIYTCKIHLRSPSVNVNQCQPITYVS